MDREQKAFLRHKLKKAVAQQPGLTALRRLLTRLGGRELVAPPTPDDDLPVLLECGFVFGGKVDLCEMRDSSCHSNVACLWKARRRKIVAIATGYALSEDGLWRQHSWGIARDALVETTELRKKYFGIVLTGKEADDFAARN